jgi:hypothetical protein
MEDEEEVQGVLPPVIAPASLGSRSKRKKTSCNRSGRGRGRGSADMNMVCIFVDDLICSLLPRMCDLYEYMLIRRMQICQPIYFNSCEHVIRVLCKLYSLLSGVVSVAKLIFTCM